MSVLSRMYNLARVTLSARLDRWEESQRQRGTNGSAHRRRHADQDSAANHGSAESNGNEARNGASIPDDPNLAQFYANLEISYGSDVETARRAWKTMMKKYHPDLHGNDPERQRVATILTQELTAAYRAIEAAQKRTPPPR